MQNLRQKSDNSHTVNQLGLHLNAHSSAIGQCPHSWSKVKKGSGPFIGRH